MWRLLRAFYIGRAPELIHARGNTAAVPPVYPLTVTRSNKNALGRMMNLIKRDHRD